mmetsp:Transcript_17164/g.31111  ORF Transcript_17164/g.31111 Transcript_17164/m.31111 type:complete len:238 (+) Transcript_17164:196-909(+)
MCHTHGIHTSIGINSHEKPHHIRLQVQIDHGTLNRTIELGEFPPIVNAIVVSNGNQLGIALTTIPRLGRGGGLGRKTHLGNDNVLEELVSLLQNTMINSCAVLGVGDSDTVVLEGIILELINVESQNVGEMFGGGHVLAVARHQTVGHHEQHLVLIGIRRVQHTLNSLAQFVIALVVTRHHDHHGAHDILLGIRSMAGTYVNHGGDELNDHERGDEDEHDVHHDVEGGAKRVEFIVQ